MSTGPFAIVVSVPRAERDYCFLATPFVPDFAMLSALVVRAANPLGLQVIRTDEIQVSDNFPRDIVVHTRAARVIVAVCSPEADSGKPNPNVMYELGLAHALGKPTVMITSSKESLPADIRVKYVLPYDPDRLHEEEYASKLVQEIRQAMRDRLTPATTPHQPGGEEISIAYSRHKMLLAPRFWDDFRTVLSFGKEIHDQMQAIDSGQVDSLVRGIEDIVFRPGSIRQKVGNFNKAWKDYSTYYQSITVPNVFETLASRLVDIDDCFNRLPIEVDDVARPAIDTAHGFYNKLKDVLQSYPVLHDAVVRTTGENFVSLLENRETSRQIHAHVQNLSSTSKRCIIWTDRLIVNLIGIML